MEFSMNPEIARGDAIVREKYYTRLTFWEKLRGRVKTDMGNTGFPPHEVAAADKQWSSLKP